MGDTGLRSEPMNRGKGAQKGAKGAKGAIHEHSVVMIAASMAELM